MSKRKTLEEFCQEASEVHGKYYDYSKVNYLGNKQEVEIVCPIHGSFLQRAGHHLKGSGCKACASTKRPSAREARRGLGGKITLQIFLKAARELFGPWYDYSNVVFNTSRDKIQIKCPKHGSFMQTVSGHLAGYGCKECGTEKTSQRRSDKARESFINKAQQKHQNFYQYDKTIYKSSKEPVEINCPHHGPFLQLPNVHLRGSGCKQCGITQRADSKRKPFAEILNELNSIHNSYYKYKESTFSGVNKYMTIVCPIHGEFKQTPNNHRSGKGCPKCKDIKIGDALRKSQAKVIDEFKKIHGDKYDYLEALYINSDTPIKIICPTHGPFNQSPYNHLSGRGCPRCKESSGEALVAAKLTSLNLVFIAEWKDHDCGTGKGKAKFDFYVPSLQLLIEFDGEQHYEPVRFGGITAEKAMQLYQETVRRDAIKNAWAEKNKMNVLRIRFDDDIDSAINEKLNLLRQD